MTTTATAATKTLFLLVIFETHFLPSSRSRGEENKSGVKEERQRKGADPLEDNRRREERTIKAAVKDTFVPSLPSSS